MTKQWTIEDLRAMSVHARADLHKNAIRRSHTPEGAALKKLIEEAGLPFSEEAALRSGDPITLKMVEIIYSNEGRDAALRAARNGQAAMAGVDPLLQAALGSDYGPHNMATNVAGQIVGDLMRSLGYRNGGKKKLPENCVAKTAETWV